ncbi:hypothetical protein QN382_03245 [Pseudomonas sp. 10B1]|uniref:hypothetical protein n=1 Tax=unclassified Pseudomonas TaxID=196821 RepID=UPI002AB41151|nr:MULTISPECIES: hypothetical protein [unclassified Pseudomonas]MDY7562843.1 hypothetical protein [Pseudomonas sp. AB6]MEA9978711.1 hypothetical protein [Pseudomonas sp. RTS4]MEA9994358.1 hypothetical protein [Pseudomonas sp. AA4]MEB0088768.1 hypothetical protein [Pseudomonas sp. RTI1]MEB0126612.1 hypothetical protein [Pseudomonas sp. CCC1.2]
MIERPLPVSDSVWTMPKLLVKAVMPEKASMACSGNAGQPLWSMLQVVGLTGVFWIDGQALKLDVYPLD